VMLRAIRNAVIGAAAGFSLLVAVPAAASAASLFVGPSASAPGNSCGHAGYTSIQQAIDVATPGSTITVCGGTYGEQLEIGTEVSLIGKGNPVVALPATPQASKTACDEAIDAVTGGADQDLVSICGPKVSVRGIAFEAKWPEGTCENSLYNVMVAGGGTLDASKVTLDGAGAYPINGCQGGVALEVGFGYDLDEVGHASLSKVTIENYQKNGVTVDGTGSTAAIAKTTVTGAGPADQGQNGIQVSRGAVATIAHAKISANECTVSSCGSGSREKWAEDAAGVLFYEPGASSSVTSSKLAETDIGVEYVSSEPPAKSEISLGSDKISGGYASVQLNQGEATLTRDRLSGALVGIDLGSYWGENDSYGPQVTATGDKVAGSTAAVLVESSLAGLAGSLTISGGRIDGAVINNDPQFTISG
jgi:hypothetical protein